MRKLKNWTLLYIIEKGEVLSKKEIEKIIAFKIQETTCEVLTWNEGKYSFEAGKKLYQRSSFSVEIEPNTLVMEGMRRIDEWPLIEQALPDENVVLRKLEKPEIEIEIGEDENIILKKITEDISLKELVGISGIGKFRTYNSVYKLTEIGIIAKIPGEAKPRQKGYAKKTHISFSFNLKRFVLYGFLLIHILFFFKFRLPRIGNDITNIKNLIGDPSRIETILPISPELEK